MKRAHIIVSGKVQGVFYRDFVRKEADKFGISGFV
ncbi:acylphosphatase, partial [Candidatus Woesearchaeota archaeon]|nr:acylphosphatase [Candidatus Woesearchaeota archaeon]